MDYALAHKLELQDWFSSLKFDDKQSLGFFFRWVGDKKPRTIRRDVGAAEERVLISKYESSVLLLVGVGDGREKGRKWEI